MIAAVVAMAGLATALTAWIAYLATVPSGRVPARPVGSIALSIGGTLAAVAALVVGYRAGGPGLAVAIPAGLALVLGPGFLLVLTQRKTPIGNLTVKVGDPLLAFASQTSDGARFHTDELAGRRVLLKFFRGHW